MIGTGIVTSLGFQLTDIQNTWSIVLIWGLGGVFALIGAFTYAELGTNFDESGGDYIFLSKLIHPLVGYVYAWISLTVGFTTPIAISVMAMKSYLNPINPSLFNEWFGVAVILVLAAIHSVSIGQSSTIYLWVACKIFTRIEKLALIIKNKMCYNIRHGQLENIKFKFKNEKRS